MDIKELLRHNLIFSFGQKLNASETRSLLGDKRILDSAVAASLVVFALAWTLILALAYSNAGLHPDVLETWSLGRELEWGYPKHPPLMAWIARGWSAVFPVSGWSFQLLAMLNAALALWIVDRIGRRFLDANQRITVLLLLLLTPAYHLHAQRFNANTVLLALWPLATLCFLRSFEAGRPARVRAVWAAAAGATTALAVLGKYYSLVLVASFALSAMLHPLRRHYLLSFVPWLSTAIGLAVLAPHLNWLLANEFPSVDFARSQHGGNSLGETLGAAMQFLAGTAGYLALPVLAWLVICRSPRTARIARLKPAALMLLLVFACTVVLPIIPALITRTELAPLWALQGLFAFVIGLVASARAVDSRNVGRLLATQAAATIALLALAPVHAWYRNTHPLEQARTIMLPTTEALQRQWRMVSTAPLRFVSGEEGLALALAFYASDHPKAVPALDFERRWSRLPPAIVHGGFAAMCFQDNFPCLNWLNSFASDLPVLRRVTLNVNSSYLGVPGEAAAIVAVIVPPAGDSGTTEQSGN